MTDFIRYCNQLSPLDEQAQADLLLSIKTKTYAKGDYLLREGDVCNYIFFINSGLAKIWSYREDKEFVHCFFAEDILFSVFDSFHSRTPSKFIITALENTSATLIHFDTMESLSKKHHCIETLFRKVTDNATASMIKRISGILEENAVDRYHQFIAENPSIAQRLSLGDVAKFLGITQPSLSRIRNLK
ncbi:CRP-like cAMP-binding protein [Larkinella arboricola]|uniref:CRP-like cAMP-binding protein n=1 Tax=Larkinella arboricola TaxID=643671 RepID=A0A327X383_LARAB|nr:Crp/Fnr family transcriptional regulator [Larkinella arboricola]RAK00139.1 CRP-like cAMP-binding protein [Larkinella arboricola]